MANTESKEFLYLGKIIRPHRKISNMDFITMVSFTSWKGAITEEEGWNYEEFYKLAGEKCCGEIDVFNVRGVLMIPAMHAMLTWAGD